MADQRRGRPEDEQLRKHENNIAAATGIIGMLQKWLRFISFFADHDNLPTYHQEYEQSREALERWRQQEQEAMEAHQRRKKR